jgi:uncharacterized membrane protein YjjB (DUF3815 family)
MVPPILPLLPGLAIVTAMLADTTSAQIALIADAFVTAFVVGIGVASGDIVVATLLRVRASVVEPAIGVVTDQLAGLAERPAGPAGTGARRDTDV